MAHGMCDTLRKDKALSWRKDGTKKEWLLHVIDGDDGNDDDFPDFLHLFALFVWQTQSRHNVKHKIAVYCYFFYAIFKI